MHQDVVGMANKPGAVTVRCSSENKVPPQPNVGRACFRRHSAGVFLRPLLSVFHDFRVPFPNRLRSMSALVMLSPVHVGGFELVGDGAHSGAHGVVHSAWWICMNQENRHSPSRQYLVSASENSSSSLRTSRNNLLKNLWCYIAPLSTSLVATFLSYLCFRILANKSQFQLFRPHKVFLALQHSYTDRCIGNTWRF